MYQPSFSALEDLNIREKALSLPDTTTRIKTVWQLKLKPVSEFLKQPDKVEKELIRADWKEFVKKKKQRRANMNACAKSCPNSGDSSSTSTNGQQLENQLYRVEIHKGGKTGIATFKWARDNASVTITPKFDQEAWQLTKPGQWLEITNEANELKGLPGVMVPFQSASLRKISFDSSRASGAIPESPTIVRRWHTGAQSEIPTSENWIELEQGIKVQFDPKSDYETGDYWLIPARTDDIEWPDNGANQPLPQPPQGIEHHYGLIGLVKASNGRFEKESLQILRTLFPPLMKCLGEDGGIIKGTLEIQNNFYVTGQKDKQIEGRIGVGLTKPLARFHLQNAKVPVAETLLVNGKTVTGKGVAELNFGDILSNQDVTLSRTVVAVAPTKDFVTLNADLTVTNANFTYQPAIARMDDGSGTTQFLITASGNTGIGTAEPMAKLDVQVTENDGSLTGFHVHKPGTGSLFYVGKDGKVGIGINTPQEKLQVAGNLRITGSSTLEGALSVGNNLNVTGKSTLDKDLSVGTTFSVDTINRAVKAASLNVMGTAQAATLEISGNSHLKGTLQLRDGATVNKFSVDEKLSDTNEAVPTEKAVIGYVATQLKQINLDFDSKADKPGSSKQDFTTQNLTVHGTFQFDKGIKVNAFSDHLTNSSDDVTKYAVPTQKAVKVYVDNVVQRYAVREYVDNTVQSLDNRLSNELSGKASKGGSQEEDFESRKLNVHENLTVIGRVGIGREPQENAKLSVDGTVEATLFRGRIEPPSSRTLKENITAISSQEVAEVLRKLNPVKYSYKEDESQSLYLGFIAEDAPDILTSTDKTAVKLVDLVAVLTKALRDNRELTKTLLKVVKKQQEDIAILTQKVNTLEEQSRE
jgi:hypothetical protein